MRVLFHGFYRGRKMMVGRATLVIFAAFSGISSLSAQTENVWIPWQTKDTKWFDDDSWTSRHYVSDADLGDGEIPAAGGYARVGIDTGTSKRAILSPDRDEVLQYFNSHWDRNGHRYLMYPIGHLRVANNFGPMQLPALEVNLSTTVNVNGVIHPVGVRATEFRIGGYAPGRMRVSGGLIVLERVMVGGDSLEYSKFDQFGTTILTSSLLVDTAIYEMRGGILEVRKPMILNSGIFDLYSGTVVSTERFQTTSGGNLQIRGGTITSPNDNFPDSFQVDATSRMTQSGGTVSVPYKASLSGKVFLDGGIFRAGKASIFNTDISGSALVETGELSILSEIEFSGYTKTPFASVSGTARVNSATMDLVHPMRTVHAPVPQGQCLLTVGGEAQVNVTGQTSVGVRDQFESRVITSPFPTTIQVNHAGAKLTSGSFSVGQLENTKGVIAARTGGIISATGEMRIGDLAGATGRAESYDAGSEIGAYQIWLGKVPGSIGELVVANGGTLRATDGIILGSVNGASQTSMVIGGVNPAGGFFAPGPVNSPMVIKGAATVNNHNVVFQHSGSGYNFTPRLQKIDTVFHSGTGSTNLTGRVWDVGTIIVNAGSVAFKHTAAVNNTGSLIISTGGSARIDGGIFRTEDVNTPRTLVGPNGSGTLSIINGGTLESGLLIGAAGATPGTARVHVEGEGSKLSIVNQDLIIGGGGTGGLFVEDAGKVAAKSGKAGFSTRIGVDPTGQGELVLRGFGSEFKSNSMIVGSAGIGKVAVSGYGVLLDSGGTTIGEKAGSEGIVRISDNASWRVAGNELVVGSAGSGTVQLAYGGTLRVGPQGLGYVALRSQASGTGVLEFSSNEKPGILLAKSVYGYGTGKGRAVVRFSHRAADYVFAPQLQEVDLQISSGNTGTTTLTSRGHFLSYCSITSGGLRFAEGSTAFLESDLVIGDGNIIDMDQADLAFLEVDGPGTEVDAANGVIVGYEDSGKLILKNGGKLIVRNSVSQAEHALLLGKDNGETGGKCSVVFGGAPEIAPGILDAYGIYCHNASGEVTFNHSAANYVLPGYITGKINLRSEAGTTLVTGYCGYTGTTSVTGGTLLLSQGTPSIVTVGARGTFGGTGTVTRINAASGSTLSPGTFRPGEKIGSLRVTTLNLFGGARISIDLGPNLTCDQILNHRMGNVTTSLLPVTSGNINFDFRNRGINRPGAYPVMTTTNAFPESFMNRLVFTTDVPLQGYFRQMRVTDNLQTGPYSRLDFVVTSLGSLSQYITWVESFGLDIAGNGGATEDPDHDGLANMIEFMLKSSPVGGQSSNLPVIMLSSTHGEFSFVHRALVDDLFKMEVEYSTDMAHWILATPGMIQTTALGDPGIAITAKIPRPASSKGMFYRLKVSTAVSNP